MRRMLKALRVIVLIVVLQQVLVRLVRHYFKFPIPVFLVEWIDNPIRNRWMPPEIMVQRHAVQPGTRVLEIGPGKGTYTLATAKHLGTNGHLTAVDIEPRIIGRLRERAQAANIANLTAEVADVLQLPYPDASFDSIYMMATLGELPQINSVLDELTRVLKPGGIIAVTEMLPDADYMPLRSLKRIFGAHGYVLRKQAGHAFVYTAQFSRAA